jgi:hypothetical protein
MLADAKVGTQEFASQGWWGVASWGTCILAGLAQDWGYWIIIPAVFMGLSVGRVSWGAWR